MSALTSNRHVARWQDAARSRLIENEATTAFAIDAPRWAARHGGTAAMPLAA